MASGEVVVFDGAKGYGFVRPDSGGEDVFVHVNDLLFDKHGLSVGARLAFDVDEGDRGLKASNVRLLGEDRDARAASGAAAANGATGSAGRGGGRASPGHPLQTELTEALLARVPSLTSEQLLAVRTAVLEVMDRHGGSAP